MKKRLYISNVDTKKITQYEIRQIANVEKDMWAYGIGEYVKCNSCGKINSKEEIFGHLDVYIKNNSVDYLENNYLSDCIYCNYCYSQNTEFIYDIDENIKNIMDRYKNSISSYISILHDDNLNIKGFCDGYVDNFYSIYDRELKSHYQDNVIFYLEKLINKKYSININKKLFFSLSSLGTFQNHSSILNLIKLLKNFSFFVDDKFVNLPSITEFDKGSPVQVFSGLLGIELLNIPNHLKYNIHDNYKSNLYYLDGSIKKGRDLFSKSAMEIIKKSLINKK